MQLPEQAAFRHLQPRVRKDVVERGRKRYWMRMPRGKGSGGGEALQGFKIGGDKQRRGDKRRLRGMKSSVIQQQIW